MQIFLFGAGYSARAFAKVMAGQADFIGGTTRDTAKLAALKQDARDFGWQQMVREREKRERLLPLYLAAKQLLPKLAISQQNLHHYASLANFYTVFELRRMKCPSHYFI